jgi:hypothetical protein
MTTRVSELPVAASFDSDDDFYVVQDGNSRKVAGSVVRGPVFMAGVSTGSGSLLDFNGIPSWASEVKIMFNQVSFSGSDNLIILLGTSSEFEATGYISGGTVTSSATVSTFSTTGGLVILRLASGRSISGIATINRYDATSTLWHYSASAFLASNVMSYASGIKSTSTALTRLRITRDGGNTFSGGSINVSYR